VYSHQPALSAAVCNRVVLRNRGAGEEESPDLAIREVESQMQLCIWTAEGPGMLRKKLLQDQLGHHPEGVASASDEEGRCD
jgi:hypothetical protein